MLEWPILDSEWRLRVKIRYSRKWIVVLMSWLPKMSVFYSIAWFFLQYHDLIGGSPSHSRRQFSFRFVSFVKANVCSTSFQLHITARPPKWLQIQEKKRKIQYLCAFSVSMCRLIKAFVSLIKPTSMPALIPTYNLLPIMLTCLYYYLFGNAHSMFGNQRTNLVFDYGFVSTNTHLAFDGLPTYLLIHHHRPSDSTNTDSLSLLFYKSVECTSNRVTYRSLSGTRNT